eukprot:364974-Chlamydomonas_euryale.AAC.11
MCANAMCANAMCANVMCASTPCTRPGVGNRVVISPDALKSENAEETLAQLDALQASMATKTHTGGGKPGMLPAAQRMRGVQYSSVHEAAAAVLFDVADDPPAGCSGGAKLDAEPAALPAPAYELQEVAGPPAALQVRDCRLCAARGCETDGSEVQRPGGARWAVIRCRSFGGCKMD